MSDGNGDGRRRSAARLSAHDVELVRHQVHRYALQAGVSTYPVDVAWLLERAGLRGPYPLFGEEYETWLNLNYRQPRGANEFVEPWEDALGGILDPNTHEVFINEALQPERRRFVLAHELMHQVLGHASFMLIRGGAPPHRRREMEAEASLAAVELLVPADELKNFLRAETYPGRRPSLRELRRAAQTFGITLYTAARQYVERASDTPVALLTLSIPRGYRGSQTPAWLRAHGYESPSWLELRREVGGAVLSTGDDPVGRRAFLALSRQANPRIMQELLRELERRYECAAELYLTGSSLHVLLTV